MKKNLFILPFAFLLCLISSCTPNQQVNLLPFNFSNNQSSVKTYSNSYEYRVYRDFEVKENYIIISDENYGIRILDALTHEEKAGLKIENSLGLIARDDNSVFVPTHDGIVHIVDISTPEKPSLISKIQTNIDKKLNQVRSISISNKIMQIFANAIDANQNDILITYDIKSLENPKPLSNLNLDSNGAEFCRSGHQVYLTSNTKTLEMFDFSQPENPQKKYSIPISGSSPHKFGNYLFLTRTIGDFKNLNRVIDIYELSKDFKPKMIFNYEYKGNYIQDIEYKDNILYLTYKNDLLITTSSIEKVDFSKPNNPQKILNTTIASGINDFKLSDNKLFITTLQGIYSLPLDFNKMSNEYRFTKTNHLFGQVFLAENRLYITSLDKMMAFELSNQLHLNRLPDLQISGGNDVKFLNGLLYFTSGKSSSLEIYNIRNPENAIKLRSLILNKPNDMAYYKGNLYISEIDGLTIFDVSQPLNPVQISKIKSVSYQFPFIKDGYLYLLDFNGLSVFDIHEPKNPQKISQLKGTVFRDLAFVGPYLYLVHNSGLKIIEASNPSELKEVSNLKLNSFGFLFNIWLYKDRAYFSDWDVLAEYSIEDPIHPKQIRIFPHKVEQLIMTDSFSVIQTDSFGKIQVVSKLEDFIAPDYQAKPLLVEEVKQN